MTDTMTKLREQLARFDSGLALYDETEDQARQTGEARGDNEYLARWMAHHTSQVIR